MTQPRSSPTPRGWSAEDLAEFDRRWLRGDTIAKMCEDFQIDAAWLNRLRRRRSLPTRRGTDGRYRGGPYDVNHARAARPASAPRKIACANCHHRKRRCDHAA